MGYRVRSPEGELHFDHLVDVAKAYRQGLVDPDDEVVEDGRQAGVKARAHPLLGEPPRQAFKIRAQQVRAAAACAVGLAALVCWRLALGLYLRAAIVVVCCVVLAVILAPLAQEAAKPKRR